MLSGVLSSSLSTGRQLIILIRRTFNIWVHPPGRSFTDKGGGKGDLSDNSNAAAPSCSMSDHDALTISSVSKMYPIAVICLFWVRDSFWVACRFWLPSHIFKMLWTMAILCGFLSFASVFISKWFSVSVVFNYGWALAKILVLAWANCLTTTFSRMASPVVFDCLQPITSRPRERLASTPTLCGTIESISCATLEGLAYFECMSSCWRHQLVISGNQNVLLISIWSER